MQPGIIGERSLTLKTIGDSGVWHKLKHICQRTHLETVSTGYDWRETQTFVPRDLHLVLQMFREEFLVCSIKVIQGQDLFEASRKDRNQPPKETVIEDSACGLLRKSIIWGFEVSPLALYFQKQ
jgi:hypothetical protein